MIGHSGPMPGRACMRCGSIWCAGADCAEDGADWEAQIVKPASNRFTLLTAEPSCPHGTDGGDWCPDCNDVCVDLGDIPF